MHLRTMFFGVLLFSMTLVIVAGGPVAGYQWVAKNTSLSFDPRMISVGADLDGNALVVGRIHHGGLIIPGKVNLKRGIGFIAYEGVEIEKTSFEILMSLRINSKKFRWITARDGSIPKNGIKGGQSADGETLYVARTRHQTIPIIGKVQPSRGCIEAPYDGTQVSYEEYQVLVYEE